MNIALRNKVVRSSANTGIEQYSVLFCTLTSRDTSASILSSRLVSCVVKLLHCCSRNGSQASCSSAGSSPCSRDTGRFSCEFPEFSSDGCALLELGTSFMVGGAKMARDVPCRTIGFTSSSSSTETSSPF
eukprot:210639-Rhodomonas_salina.2